MKTPTEKAMSKEEEYYVISYDGQMIALVEIQNLELFDNEQFVSDLNGDGYKIQKITKTQKEILLPENVNLN